MTQLADFAATFRRRVDRYGTCCRRMEHELSRKTLNVTNVELVHCASFLSVCSQWEALIEDIIFEAVCGPPSKKRGFIRYIDVRDRPRLRNLLLFPEKKYLSLTNLNSARSLASLFIRDGRPLSAVSEPNQTFLQQAIWIRNAIAHKSKHAREEFRDKVPGVKSLPPTQRLPGAFLRHEFRQQPTQRRYELYFAAFKLAATEIANSW